MDVPPEILARATVDVVATVRWLEAGGWDLVEARGPEGMDCSLLRFDDPAGDRVEIVCDRSSWELRVRLAGWARGYDVDQLCALVVGDGERRWRHDRGGYASPVRQSPPGMSWRSELPALLELLPLEPDAEARLEALGRLRADRLFGPVVRLEDRPRRRSDRPARRIGFQSSRRPD